jgi:hypothetical protein
MAMCSIRTFEKLIKKTGTSKNLVINTVRDTTQKTLEVWWYNKKHDALPKDIEEAIDKHMMNTALVDG